MPCVNVALVPQPLLTPSPQLSRLIEERNALLNTGGYSDEDALIKDIDENISSIRKGF